MPSDQPRQTPTPSDSEFTLSIDEALRRYTEAGLPRTPRSVQRYCALGHLECHRVDTPSGQKWLITPSSVDRHIAYIREVTPATSRDLSRPDATARDEETANPGAENDGNFGSKGEHRQGTTTADRPRLVATGSDDRYVMRLESENEFLRGQIAMKDVQIKDLTERARETNHLIAGLQRMLSPLLASSERRQMPPEQ